MALNNATLNDVRRILILLTPSQRRNCVVVMVLMLFGMVLETLGVGIVVPVLTLLSGNSLDPDFPGYPVIVWALGEEFKPAELATFVMLTMAGLFLVKVVFLSVMHWFQFRFVYDVQAHFSRRLFDQYLHEPLLFHIERNSSTLIRNTNQEVIMFTQGAMMAQLILFTEMLVAIGIAVLLFLVEPFGAFAVIIVIGLSSAAFLRSTRKALINWGKIRQRMEGLKVQHIQQGLGGIRDVKILGREQSFVDNFHSPNLNAARVGALQGFFSVIPRILLEFIAVSGLVALVLVLVFQGKPLQEVAPTLGLFAAAAFRLLPSANRIIGAIQNVRFNRTAVDVIEQELSQPKHSEPDSTPSATPFMWNAEISLCGLSFRYESASNTSLENVSVTIPFGSSVGIIGPSGSGKSTLVDLILGLLEPATGEIAADGKDIRENLAGWQRQIGYVPQDIFLTDDTLRRNIAFGLEDSKIDDADLNTAIDAAQLRSLVDGSTMGLDTIVGERGVKLSGGQRQRIGIARALYHNPSMLVLDEATSALDMATESSIVRALDAFKGKKTIIFVTHRQSTLKNADQILSLENGKISVPLGFDRFASDPVELSSSQSGDKDA